MTNLFVIARKLVWDTVVHRSDDLQQQARAAAYPAAFEYGQSTVRAMRPAQGETRQRPNMHFGLSLAG